MREETPEERREYPTIRDMEIELIKSGLPVEHLKQLRIEHKRIREEEGTPGV